MSPTVRDLRPTDAAAWRLLWDDYCRFYRADVPDAVTQHTWDGMIAGKSVRGLVALIDEQLVGFATYVLHPSTWEIEPICYLEDLFVAENERGRGVGGAIIDHLIANAEKNGWPRVYWHTEAANVAARKLYDRYAAADGYVRYVLRPARA